MLPIAHVAQCTICSMPIARTRIAIFIVSSYACGTTWMARFVKYSAKEHNSSHLSVISSPYEQLVWGLLLILSLSFAKSFLATEPLLVLASQITALCVQPNVIFGIRSENVWKSRSRWVGHLDPAMQDRTQDIGRAHSPS